MCYALPGPRCSNHAYAALRKALAEGNEEEIRAAKVAYATSPRGIKELVESGQAEKAEKYRKLRQKMMADLTESMTAEDLQMELIERVEGDEFKSLLDVSKEANKALEETREAYQEAKANGTDQERREALNAYREARFARWEAKENLEEFKNETGHLAARLADIVELEMEQYEGDTLGNLVALEEFPSGTVEWLRQRQEGIGGSDVGAILEVEQAFAGVNKERVWQAKMEDLENPVTAEDLITTADREHRAIVGALDRGNAWEPVLAQVFASKNPDYKLLHSKMTWADPNDPIMRVNFDGLLSSREDGQPDGILEIKTGSKPELWEDEEGNPVIPVGYRAQILHYLEVTGFDYGYVAVQLDDKTYRQYRVERGEPITPEVGTWRDNEAKIREFAQKVKEHRQSDDKRPYWKSAPRRRNPHPPIRTDAAIRTATNTVVALSGEDSEEVRQRIQNRISAGGSADGILREEMEKAVRENPYQGDYVVVDIETTAKYPASGGEIIEIGWTRINSEGEVVEEDNIVCSPDARVLRTQGTGIVDWRDGSNPADVHGITPDEVAGKPSFRDPNVQRRVKEAFKGARLVAHNAQFENSFLNQDLQGYQESGQVMLDTYHLSTHFQTDTDSNSLRAFSEANGVEYQDAHRALNDARMTAKALMGFLRTRRAEGEN